MKQLIYSCIFFNIEYLELLKLLLKSYKLFGNPTNNIDYLIISSPLFKDDIQQIFNDLKICGKIWCLDLHTKFDACCSRLKIFEYADINLYDKILYLDCDILITNSLHNIFYFPLKNHLYALKEGTTDKSYWGKKFFKENNPRLDGFTSGILLFNNHVILKDLFSKIIIHINEELTSYNYGPLFNQKKDVDFNKIFGDQPFIVYQSIKNKLYNNTKLIGVVANNPDIENRCPLKNYPTISHFPSYPGYCKNKIYKMTKFIRVLLDIKAGKGIPPLPLIVKTRKQIIKNTTFPLIGICVSYNYIDTLKFMLPINYKHFDKIYIITDENDNDTISLCKEYSNVEVLFFTFKTDTAVFNKGAALKMAQKIVYDKYPEHWYLIFDSDIILPNNFIDILQRENLNENCIYGAIRYNITRSSELFKNIKPDHKCIQNNLTFNWKIIDNGTGTGPGPGIIGSFQLYKLKKTYQSSNDSWFNGADYDFYFAWINFNIFCQLENILYIHLGETGKNWKGKNVEFIDDACIDLEQITFNCNIRCKNTYYNIKREQIKFNSSHYNISTEIWGCSMEFKQDIKEFFNDKPSYEMAEFGSHRGHTTKFLSTIFDKVYSVDEHDKWTTSFNKELNRETTNIDYINIDIYKKPYNITPNIETLFIHGPFNYEQCKIIMGNLPTEFANLKYIIIDNYGICGDIKTIINNFLDKELLIEGAYIGLNNIQNEQLTVKNTSEGIVCKINISLYKNTIWEQSFMPILENNQINTIINNKKVDLLINNTKYVSCSKLNKSGISQISIK